jgi:hypothetical protein
MWHCPHCGAPQAETARCWVCRRSSTTCSTCRHFRASLATDLGYCALDLRRRPLTGAELRGCWEERPAAGAASGHTGSSTGAPGLPVAPEPAHRLRLPSRDFVPVELLVADGPAERLEEPQGERSSAVSGTPAKPRTPAPPFLPADAADAWATRTSLFGDAER